MREYKNSISLSVQIGLASFSKSGKEIALDKISLPNESAKPEVISELPTVKDAPLQSYRYLRKSG